MEGLIIDQQNHLLSLIAVFMALGIGILMGISMGDSTLVFNQIAVIEELEGKIHSYRQSKGEIASQLLELEHELEQWEDLKVRYLQPIFKDSLHYVSITIISGEDYPAALLEFLEESGCSYRAYYLAAEEQWKFDPRVTAFSKEPGGAKVAAFSYGEILWEIIHRQEKGDRDELLVILQEHGLLEVKSFDAVKRNASSGEAANTTDDIFVLTGDISFVTSVLKQGTAQKEIDYTWIAINTRNEEAGGKSLQLPGNWITINNGAPFFRKVELWEHLKHLAKAN